MVWRERTTGHWAGGCAYHTNLPMIELAWAVPGVSQTQHSRPEKEGRQADTLKIELEDHGSSRTRVLGQRLAVRRQLSMASGMLVAE